MFFFIIERWPRLKDEPANREKASDAYDAEFISVY